MKFNTSRVFCAYFNPKKFYCKVSSKIFVAICDKTDNFRILLIRSTFPYSIDQSNLFPAILQQHITFQIYYIVTNVAAILLQLLCYMQFLSMSRCSIKHQFSYNTLINSSLDFPLADLFLLRSTQSLVLVEGEKYICSLLLRVT